MMVTWRTNERKVLSEFLEVYSNHPCLWDYSAVEYKNREKKNQAWDLLVAKLKELDPEANLVTAKKRVEHMRTTYKREAKKVIDSQHTNASEVYVPNLWYYKLLRFIDQKDEQSSKRKDPSDEVSQEEDINSRSANKSNRTYTRVQSQKKLKFKRLLRETSEHKGRKSSDRIFRNTSRNGQTTYTKKSNYFGIYVGEQLEQVATFQRHVAEKLISDVIFLAKTGNLSLHSRIESHTSTSSPSPEFMEAPSTPSPGELMPISPEYVKMSAPSPEAYNENDSETELKAPTKSVLKEFLVNYEMVQKFSNTSDT